VASGCSSVMLLNAYAAGAERAAEAYWLAQYFAAAAPGTSWPGELVCWVRQETGTPPHGLAAALSHCPMAVKDA
jgi:hypothetical protein